MRPRRAVGIAAGLFLAVLLAAILAARAYPTGHGGGPPPRAIGHVFVIGFDNVHLEDLQQMPHLWAFLQHGAFSTNHHTVLNSLTAPGFVAMASGEYPDKTGVYSNTMLRQDGSAVPGFAFWEPLVTPASLLSPPPWHDLTRAGWTVGAVGFGDMVLENDREVGALVEHPAGAAEAIEYKGLAVHGRNGKSVFGNAQIKYLRDLRYTFTGWTNMRARYSLDVTLAMVDQGVPVVYTYIENQRGDLRAGAYQNVIAEDDAAFDRFFAALAKRGITPANALFVITTDEGDYYNADGAHFVNLPQALRSQGIDAGGLRMIGGAGIIVQQPAADIPRTTTALAQVEGWEAIAAGPGLDAIHVRVRQDPARTPSFILYARADYGYLSQAPTGTFRRWNHGTVDPKITTVWLSLVGPGIQPGPLVGWSDHTDLLPTIAYLLGLQANPQWDGRVLYEALVKPPPYDRELADLYKQLNAPNGAFGREALRISTAAALSATTLRGKEGSDFLAQAVAERDHLATAIAASLRAGGSEPGLRQQASELLARVRNFGRGS